MARQNAAIEEGNRKHAQFESNLYSKAGEDFQRSFFNMTRTERQMYGLKMVTTGKGLPTTEIKKKPVAWSKCCKEEAYCYRSVSYGESKPKEEYWRCRECYNDCEIQRTKPRKKRSA